MKAYNAPHGVMGRHLCETLPIGGRIQAHGPLGRLAYSSDAKHTIKVGRWGRWCLRRDFECRPLLCERVVVAAPTVKSMPVGHVQVGAGMPRRPRTILMFAAGSGIAPMLQILRHVHRVAHHDHKPSKEPAQAQVDGSSDGHGHDHGHGHGHGHGHAEEADDDGRPADKSMMNGHSRSTQEDQPPPEILLFYANRARNGIIGERELRHFAADSKDRLRVIFSLSGLTDSPGTISPFVLISLYPGMASPPSNTILHV